MIKEKALKLWKKKKKMYIGMEIRMRADLLSTIIQAREKERHLKCTEKIVNLECYFSKYISKMKPE